MLDTGQRVVLVHHAREHPAPAAACGAGRRAQRPRRVPGVLDRRPARLEEQPFLRVEHGRLGRGDPEERRVEAVHVVEETAPRRQRPSRRAAHVAEATVVPPVARNLGHTVHTGLEVGPELAEILRAGIPACHADHRDRLRPFLPPLRRGPDGHARRLDPPPRQRGPRQRDAAALPTLLPLLLRPRREHDVRVRAAVAEAVQRGHPRPVPRRLGAVEPERRGVEIEVLRWLLPAQVRHAPSLLEHHRHLDQPRDALGTLRMADVGFHRAEHAVRCGLRAVHGSDGLQFDEVGDR
ncbi:hypothetical protein SAXI111661_20070 [Saccharomonospora xinjiangensis]